jgi:hypothetical protein
MPQRDHRRNTQVMVFATNIQNVRLQDQVPSKAHVP